MQIYWFLVKTQTAPQMILLRGVPQHIWLMYSCTVENLIVDIVETNEDSLSILFWIFWFSFLLLNSC